MQSILAEQGLYGNRVQAVDGQEFATSVIAHITSSSHRPLKPGEIGCFLSHLSIWKDAFNRNFNLIWVMEDDVQFNTTASSLIPIIQSLETIDPKWDIFYTDFGSSTAGSLRESLPGTIIRLLQLTEKEVQISPYFKKIRARQRTHSMFISKYGLQKMLRYVAQKGIVRAIDNQIHYILGLRQYTSLTSMVTYTDLGTDIQIPRKSRVKQLSNPDITFLNK